MAKRVERDLKDVNPDIRLWLLLAGSYHALFKCRSKELQKYAITPAESGVLQCLGANKKVAMNVTKIARWILREPNSVTGLLQRMENRGLVSRKSEPKRKNSKIMALTKKGQNAYIQVMRYETIGDCLSCFSEEEKQVLRGYLRRLRNNTLTKIGYD